MKKNDRKKITLLPVVLILCFALFIGTYSANEYNPPVIFGESITITLIDDIFNQEYQDYLFRKMMIAEHGYGFFSNHIVGITVLDEIYAFLERNCYGEVLYPDYWGGAFFNAH